MKLRATYKPTLRERIGFVRVGLWLKLAQLAFRKLDVVHRHEPDGIPLRRSADDPCAGYSPRHFIGGDWTGCEGDGHYLCRECSHFTPGDEDE